MAIIHSRLTGLWLLPCLLMACAKQTNAPGTASLNIFNAVVGSNIMVPNFSGTKPITYYATARIQYNNDLPGNNHFSAFSGSQPLALYEYPDTTAKSTPLFNLVLDLPIGSMHSLFLTGTFSQPDTVFIKDDMPYYPAGDSAMAFRFINLSPGSKPVTITVTGNGNSTVVSNLPYKGSTAFIKFPVTMSLQEYSFECRDAIDGTLLASYTTSGIANPGTVFPNTWLYHNFTLALVGKPNGTGTEAQATFLIAY